MQFGLWDTLFNFLTLVFWFRIWNERERQVVFNPYLAPLARMSDSTLGFLRPVFAGLSSRAVCGVIVVLLILLRGLAVPRNAQWVIAIGFARQARLTPAAGILFSLLSFAVFLFKLWGLTLIYDRSRRMPSEHTTASLHLLGRPFTRIRPEYRPAVLLAIGMVLVAAADLAGQLPRVAVPGVLPAVLSWGRAAPPVTVIQLAILALTGWAQVLLILQQFMIILIIMSWVSIFTSSQQLMLMGRDWLNLLLGPLRRYPIRLGPIDLSPIVFFFAVAIVHFVLLAVLQTCYGLIS